MSLLPKSHEDFSQKEYWNSFFAKRGKKAFEWYGEYPELCVHIHKYVKVKDDVLIIGCGNSKLSVDMYDIGYKKLTNIDISKVVIRQMRDQNLKTRPDMIFEQMDVLNMTFPDDSFSVIIDKGTLDALMPNSEPEVIKQIDKMFQEIQRVLKFGGRYLCISLLQEHILRKLLDYFPKANWMFRIVRCHEVEQKTQENGENSLPVFLVLCTKFKQLPDMILESCLAGTTFQRYTSPSELLEAVLTAQRAALVFAGLQRGRLDADHDEVMLELCDSSNNKSRYTIHVLEQSGGGRGNSYAAFIVPQGRETEWIFTTKEGRKNLLKSTNYNRLTIVSMHRGQKYESLDAVKTELNSTILNLAPRNAPKPIPCLSLGEDVGKRDIRFEGTSEFSGRFVVEDVTDNKGNIFRRLIFLNNQNVIQSEVKLKKVKSRSGYHLYPDYTFVPFHYHVYMTLGLTLIATKTTPPPRVLLVGLGGGGLCGWLSHIFPSLHLTAVDIDVEIVRVAKEWFGLKEEWAEVVVGDGMEFLKQAVEKEMKYDAVIFDVDSKDATVGMSCPPKQFLDQKTLDNVKKLMGTEGIFILNLVLRDESLRKPIISKIKTLFSQIFSYKLEEDLNEILFCRNNMNGEKQWKSELKNAAEELNSIVKKQKIYKSQLIDIISLMTVLKLC